MKPPAQIKPWLTVEGLAAWVEDAPDREAYRRRLAIWLTHIGPFHAQQVATMLRVSRQAVWLWVAQYNKHGPKGLQRRGRGGRRWSYLSVSQEERLVRRLEERASRGEVATAPRLLPEVQAKLGRRVSLGYVYKLLHRHGWRKVGPHPHHVKGDEQRRQEFKKNSPL